jgi:hypothetical protein
MTEEEYKDLLIRIYWIAKNRDQREDVTGLYDSLEYIEEIIERVINVS